MSRHKAGCVWGARQRKLEISEYMNVLGRRFADRTGDPEWHLVRVPG